MTTDVPVALHLGGGCFLVGPIGALHAARAISLVEAEARLHGATLSSTWVQLRDVIVRAAEDARTFANETAKVRSRAAVPTSAATTSGPDGGWIGVEQMAALLGCSEQWCRALLRRGEFTSARRRSRAWVVDANEVVAWATSAGQRARAATENEAAA